MGGGGGRGGRARTQRKHFRQSRENVWKRPKSDPSSDANENNNSNNDRSGHNNNPWEPFSTENPIFNEYYKEQGIVSADEWDAFIAVIRTPLPAAFRINSSSQFCADIRSQLENEFMKSLQAEVINDGEVQAIRPLPWYPQNLAWHSNFSRMQLRKNQTLERFHNFLKLENEIGNITRQEAVSMVPPLFLDVHPEHFVLDMCAAPGSKTFQLLEIVHQSTKPGFLPDGMVVANDLDVQRCNLLIHQTKRMCTANLVVTNHEAQHFPGCRLKRNSSNASEVGIESNPCMSQLIFDRVLCDVPCSGDGTLRKAPDIWRKWNVGMGNGIHGLQIQIAIRGVSLLKVGGRMVYSTCSMNPVENEAVVAEILRRCEGSLELLDVSSELPQLVLRPGLRKWKIRDKGSWLASYKDVKKYRKTVIYPSMFPSGRSYVDSSDSNDKKGSEERPEDDSNDKKESEERPEDDSNDKKESEEKPEDDSNGDSTDGVQMVDTSTIPADGLDEEVCEFPLERCMRILPHDQNTGAFFIAVFKKVSPLPTMKNKQDNRDKGDNYTNDKPVLELPNQEVEDIDGLNINSAERTDEKLPEGASKADLIDDGPNEASKKDDPSATAEENNSTEAQEPVEKEIDPKKTRGKRKLQMQGKWKGVDPVVILKDETIINGIKSFYGIDESFPFHGHLVTRNSDITHMKRIYYISKSVKDVLELNFSVGQQLKIASIGIKMFERQTAREGNTAPCSFRISSEGLPLILPYISKQVLTASPPDFKHLLQYKTIKFADFVDSEFGQKASNLMLGSCVVILGKGSKATPEDIKVDKSTIAIGCWKGRASLTVMVTAVDCEELLERLMLRSEIKNGSSIQKEDEEKEKHSNGAAVDIPDVNDITGE